MAARPIWYELMTPEPGAVASFYRATLGWDIPAEGHPIPNGAEYREIARADGGFAGGVLKFSPQMAGMPVAWLTYFHVADVDAAVAQATAAGAQVHIPATTMDGVGRMAMLTDPQGAAFYVMDPTPPPDNPDAQSDVFDPMKPGRCWWNELNTNDTEAALAFYLHLFDWTAGEAMPMGEFGTYQFIEAGGEAIGAINPCPDKDTRPLWLPVFGVADIDAAEAAVLANGGAITVATQEIPGGQYALTCTDPGGAALGLVGPKGA